VSAWGWWLIGAVIALGVLVLYLSNTAGRLDRLHRRIDVAEHSLDTQLLRRSSVAMEIATSGLLDPASAVLLADAAHMAAAAIDARASDQGQASAQAESVLTRALDLALDDDEVTELRALPAGESLLEDLEAAALRVQLARRFLNDAVRACRQLRGRRTVRWFSLAGRTPWPHPREMDDSLPESLGRSS
jgi:hypothetical protein